MLVEIALRHFKCFETIVLPLGSLTLLSGSNASGKSSALQALVLLQQTISEHEWSARLMLNADSIRRGTVLEAVDKVHGRRQFEIGLVDGTCAVRWTFHGDREEMSMAAKQVVVDRTDFDHPAVLRHLIPQDRYEECSNLAM